MKPTFPLCSFIFALFVGGVACGQIAPPVADDDDHPGAAAQPGSEPAIEPALPDAGTAAPRQAQVTSGSGRLAGGDFVLDVQIGHGHGQTGAASASFTLTGAGPVNP